jgi:membrane-associated HD superfamily phosphohydrolase
MNEIDLLKDIWTIIGPIVAAFLTYFIAIKGKQKDVDIVKEQKLNLVISNMLDVWNYLWFLKRISIIKNSDLPVPFKALSVILFKSDMINDKCFNELTNSTTLLKEYDPITYYNLSGIGEKFDYIRKNLILPFINSKTESKLNSKIQDTYLLDTINDIEDYMQDLTKELSRKTSKRLLKKIKENEEKDIEEIKDELIKNYYEFMMDVIPEGIPKPEFEEFKAELNNPELNEIMSQQFELISKNEFSAIMEQVAIDPNMSIEEMVENLNNQSPTANKV